MSLRSKSLAASLLAAAAGAALAAPGDGFESRSWHDELAQAMANPDWIGPPVETPYWSLDGRAIQYALKRNGSPLRDAWTVELAAPTPRKLDDAALAGLDGPDPVWSADRQRAAFIRHGDVFVREPASGTLRQLTRSSEEESDPLFAPDGSALLWRSGQRWYRYAFATGLTSALAELKAEKDPAREDPDLLRERQLRLSSTLQRLRDEREVQRERERELRVADPGRAPAPIWLGEGIGISQTAASPDARWMLVVTEPKAADPGRTGKLPTYVTESGYEEAEDVRTRVGRNPPIGQALLLVDLVGGSVAPVDLKSLPGIGTDPLADLRKAAGKPALEGLRAVRIDAIEWNRQGDRAALMIRAVDNKDRWIATLQPQEAQLHSRHRLTDPAWINWSFNEFGWQPDGRSLWYLSEESGYSHLYEREDHDRRKPVALTDGRWETSAVQWNADASQAFFLCNRAWPGDYEVCRFDRRSGKVEEVTAVDGVDGFVLSPDAQRLALSVSAHHTPPQLAVVDLASGRLDRLTDTRSEAYRSHDWLAPQFVQVPSKHGAGAIWGKFYRPQALEAGKRYPIVLFVHGAGYLQNVHARWPAYFREQMFNQMLVERGYLVLDLDYRASEGYGRDWRTAIYRQMGHPELEDYLDGIEWLVDSQQGDRSRVGIYGGSYGGFMSLMALFRAPDAFKAGAALRPVSDWTSYNHEYTSNILNTPELDPEAYRVSSPIEYADNLQGQLLIAHGMIDDNVFYQDSVRLSQRLIELRKDGWELASYPLERHGFVHADSWYDEYRRIYELFERSLRP